MVTVFGHHHSSSFIDCWLLGADAQFFHAPAPSIGWSGGDDSTLGLKSNSGYDIFMLGKSRCPKCDGVYGVILDNGGETVACHTCSEKAAEAERIRKKDELDSGVKKADLAVKTASAVGAAAAYLWHEVAGQKSASPTPVSVEPQRWPAPSEVEKVVSQLLWSQDQAAAELGYHVFNLRLLKHRREPFDLFYIDIVVERIQRRCRELGLPPIEKSQLFKDDGVPK